MPESTRSTIGVLLNKGELAIANTLAIAEIKTAMAAAGYPDAKMAEARTLLDSARKAVALVASLKGAQKKNTEALKTAWKDAANAYQSLSETCKAVYRAERSILTALGLDKKMPKATADFIKRGMLLFDNAAGTAAIAAKLAEHGYTAARLQSDRAKFAAFDKANKDQEAAKGAYQQAAREERKLLKDFEAWLNKFTRLAKVALKAKPDLLEKLGILARSKRPVKKAKKEAKEAKAG
ncbi:MAG: hypothetical protein QME74_03075 [Candidatus Edwardsbacteria bacterium]|nr:hypothetical protein [Candidatus Edwardsbacteria bacterium]